MDRDDHALRNLDPAKVPANLQREVPKIEHGIEPPLPDLRVLKTAMRRRRKDFNLDVASAEPFLSRGLFPLPHLKAYSTNVEYSVRRNPFYLTTKEPTADVLAHRDNNNWLYPAGTYAYDLLGYGEETSRLHAALVKRTAFSVTQLLHKVPSMPPAVSDEYAYGMDHKVYRNLGVDCWSPWDVLSSAYHGRSLYTLLKASALKPVLGELDEGDNVTRYEALSPRAAIEGVLGTTIKDLWPLLKIVAESEGLPEPRSATVIGKALKCQAYGPAMKYLRFPDTSVKLQAVNKHQRKLLLRAYMEQETVAEARLYQAAYDNLYDAVLTRFKKPNSIYKRRAKKHLMYLAEGYDDTNPELRRRSIKFLLAQIEDYGLFEEALNDHLHGITENYEPVGRLTDLDSLRSPLAAQAMAREIMKTIWMRILLRMRFRTHHKLMAHEYLLISMVTGVSVMSFINYDLWEETTWELGTFDSTLPQEVAGVLDGVLAFNEDSKYALMDQLLMVDSSLALRVADRHRFWLTETTLRTAYPLQNI